MQMYVSRELITACPLCHSRYDISSTSQCPNFTKFGHDTGIHFPSKSIGRDFWKFFFMGHLL